MTEVAFSSSFKRAFKRRIEGRKDLEEKFWRQVGVFADNPHDPRLRTHKLSGELRGLCSFTVEYDVRVVVYFLPKHRAVFVGIGTHDELY